MPIAPVLWLVIFCIAAACFGWRDELPWLVSFPDAWTIPLAAWVNSFMDWFVDSFRWLFQSISWLLNWPLDGIKSLLQNLPWSVTCSLFIVLAYVSGGLALAVFTLFALLYMVVVGYWQESMNTLALVMVAVPLSVSLGFAIGLWAYKKPIVDGFVQPLLDIMQTMPTFAYLIPILLLFGFGPVVGLIASIIYACPPMVRNTSLALRRVPAEVIESGCMSGADKRQLLWLVQVPSAMPTILIGVNQTTMAALSMVIIAAIIGSSADIGWEVLSTMRKAQFGQSLLAGIVIALIAMVIDRIGRGFAEQRPRHGTDSFFYRYRVALLALLAGASCYVASLFIPLLYAYPEHWVVYPAEPINNALNYITATYPQVTDSIKETVLFYFLLPLRIGLETAVRPFSWGFELTPAMSRGYALGAGLLAAWFFWVAGWRWAVTAIIAASVLYFGMSRIPWPVFISAVTLIAWQAGGRKIGLFAFAGLLFILLNGVWAQAMLSVYLCMAAVLVCLVLGGAIGVWAAHDARVSALIRPLNDTLQTIPLFVLLIPVLMFFQVGEFTAFLAIIAYAIVPAIRYTEHGLRNVDPEIIEAARALGCTRWQILWRVKLPLATPEIMLGLNQTIMFALAMLVIAALVGTRGLGQAVYIALGKADPGEGLVAGFSMALLAMIADRIIQAWSAQKKLALGLV